MRTRNELQRLAAAGRPLLAGSESQVDAAEEDRILGLILASPRPASRPKTLRLRAAIVLAGAAGVVAAIAAVASGVFASSHSAAPHGGGRKPVALTGAKIELAGYHFRTPAGFKSSGSGCMSAPVAGEPRPALDGFAAAAAADGACVEGAYVVAGDWLETHSPIPDSAQPVDVGSYQGYYVSAPASGDESSLYVKLPHGDGDRVVYVLLLARDVPEDELIAIAASGLPTLPPPGPTTTTGTESNG